MISSPRNPTVQAVRRLARAPARARAEAGAFLLEGPEGIRDALAAGTTPTIMLATPGAADRHAALVAAARAAGTQVALVDERLLAGLAGTVTPQGLLAVVPSVTRPLAALPRAPRLVCVLDQVRDPGNAGTVLRAADAFGAGALVTTHGSVDVQSPKAARAAAGSLFHVPVVAGARWAELAPALRGRGLALVGADPHAARGAGDADLERPVALVLGNESRGLGAATRHDLDDVVRVPTYGRAESLNLAAAAAVLLYETARRQRAAGEEVAVGR